METSGLASILAGTFPITRFTSTDLLCFIIHGEIMSLTIGTQLGSYEITGLLSARAGGMSEVYRRPAI